jgi:ribosomal protein S18 acetylase RimI-like enzyme
LVVELIARLEALGAPRVLLYAMVQNENARRLFSSLGFEVTMIEMTREARRD